MRILPLLALFVIPVAAQPPFVQLRNLSRSFSGDFQIGDRFEIVITGAPDQTISVRTARQGRIDWSPVIGSTGSAGRWSTTGQFEKSDFGSWSEIWTVGGKLATPVLLFSVAATCPPGGRSFMSILGPNEFLLCETATGPQTFATPSLSDAFRTPDGRLIPGGPPEQTPRQYQMHIIEYLVTGGNRISVNPISLQSPQGGGLGDETADLISGLIGVNALTEDETRNVVTILRAAFERPEAIQLSARQPSRTLTLLRRLADSTAQENLKREIAETIAYVQAR